MCFCGISHSNLINNQLRAESAREAERSTYKSVCARFPLDLSLFHSYKRNVLVQRVYPHTCIIYIYIYMRARVCVRAQACAGATEYWSAAL